MVAAEGMVGGAQIGTGGSGPMLLPLPVREVGFVSRQDGNRRAGTQDGAKQSQLATGLLDGWAGAAIIGPAVK